MLTSRIRNTELTSNQQRVSAMTLLDMTARQISRELGVSVGSVRSARKRLRSLGYIIIPEAKHNAID